MFIWCHFSKSWLQCTLFAVFCLDLKFTTSFILFEFHISNHHIKASFSSTLSTVYILKKKKIEFSNLNKSLYLRVASGRRRKITPNTMGIIFSQCSMKFYCREKKCTSALSALYSRMIPLAAVRWDIASVCWRHSVLLWSPSSALTE